MKIKKYKALNEAEETKEIVSDEGAEQAPEEAHKDIPDEKLAGSPKPETSDEAEMARLIDIDWFVNWNWSDGDNTIIPLLNKFLDGALDINHEMMMDGKMASSFPNLYLVSQPGAGKTAKVTKWARANNVHLLNLNANGLDATDVGGVPVIEYETVEDPDGTKREKPHRMKKVSSGIVDQLNKSRSVLFLDEVNRAEGAVKNALLTLINNHYLDDDSAPGGRRYFPKFLFTVCCVNPIEGDMPGDYEQETDAFRNRVGKFDVDFDYADDKVYQNKRFSNSINKFKNVDWKSFKPQDIAAAENEERWWQQRTPEEVYKSIEDGTRRQENRKIGNRAIVDTLLANPEQFHYTSGEELAELRNDPDWNGQTTSSRSIEALCQIADGTKEDFLKYWPAFCNNLQLPEIENILSTYTDVVDKANSVFNQASRSELFQQHKVRPTVDLRKKYGKKQ